MTTPTFNKVDMLNCAAGHHDFSDDADECRVCGHKEILASAPADDGWALAELQRVRERANVLETLLAQAVDGWPQFDSEDDVNGGDLVEWFGQWRERAKAVLDGETSNLLAALQEIAALEGRTKADAIGLLKRARHIAKCTIASMEGRSNG